MIWRSTKVVEANTASVEPYVQQVRTGKRGSARTFKVCSRRVQSGQFAHAAEVSRVHTLGYDQTACFSHLTLWRHADSVRLQDDSTEGRSHVPEPPKAAVRYPLASQLWSLVAAACRKGRLVQDAIANDGCGA